VKPPNPKYAVPKRPTPQSTSQMTSNPMNSVASGPSSGPVSVTRQHGPPKPTPALLPNPELLATLEVAKIIVPKSAAKPGGVKATGESAKTGLADIVAQAVAGIHNDESKSVVNPLSSTTASSNSDVGSSSKDPTPKVR
jgi:hypothetical protein